MTRRSILLCAVLLALTALRVNAAVHLRLHAEPSSQLPAITPTLRVEAVNTGSTPAELPRAVALQVTPPAERKPFVACTGLRGNDRVTWFHSDEDAPSIVLAPGETRDLSFWAGPESPAWLAADSRLLSPGAYRFQLIAHAELDSKLLEKVERAVDQTGLTDPIVSNEAAYLVEIPAGEDAAVWELIKQLPSPTFWVDALGSRIWAEYPNSRYAAYCLNEPKATKPSVAIAAYRAALEKKPSRSWAEWFRLGIASFEIRQSEDFISARDVEGAFAAIERAGTILTQLISESANPTLRNEAQQLVDRDILSRDALVDYIKRLSGEVLETRAYAVCVEKLDDGKHIFWFGYDNVSNGMMKFTIGPDNKFTPPPFDRGQPTTFPQGSTVLGVRIETKEPAVTWHLQKSNVQASLEKTQPCPADLHERFTYETPQRD